MSEHSFYTDMAIRCLDEHDREVWRHVSDAIIDDYCTWPDQYFDPSQYRRIAPYQLVIDELPFHYPPPSHAHYHWRMVENDSGPQLEPTSEEPNRNWQFMRDGIKHYLTTIIDDLSAGRSDDAARRLGILLHVMQETHELHALEGPWGTDLFVLDRLLQWPGGDEYLSPTLLFTKHMSSCREGSISGYKPRLHGASIDEAVLRLYWEYVNADLSNRLLHVPIAQALIRAEHDTANRLFGQINERVAKLSADVIHTVTALSTDRFDPSELNALSQLSLDPMAAVHRPWVARGIYRFTPFVPGACLDRQRRRHPMCLRQPDGSTRQFTDGWGSGAHVHLPLAFDIPSGVYHRLTAQIGLHDPLGNGGCVDLAVTVDAKPVVAHRLEAVSPTVAVDVPIHDGGQVRFVLSEVFGSDPNSNNIVWGNPVLSKSTFEE